MTLDALLERLALLWPTPHRFERGVICHVHEDFTDAEGNDIRLRVMIQTIPKRKEMSQDGDFNDSSTP